MKLLIRILGVLAAIVVVVVGAQIIASETGEVVELHTLANSESHTTRLWVVDHEDRQWLRSGGGAAAGWLARLEQEPRVELTRGGSRGRYQAVVVPDKVSQINALMAAKYGWRDQVVGAFVPDRSTALAIRLDPLSD